MSANRHPLRLAIATSAELPDFYVDDQPLIAALEARGIQLQPCIWSDPTIRWQDFDAVLIRTIWDYFRRYDEYLAWLDRLAARAVSTINPLPLLRWNSDKRYLLDLQQHGVAIVPTRIVAGTEVAAALNELDAEELVIKPTVSGTAWHTLRGRRGDAQFADAVAALPAHFAYLVQPFIEEIVSTGEWSLIFFDGRYSHAVIKRAASGDYRVQSEFGGTASACTPPAPVIAAARQALAAVAAIGYRDSSYARVDGVISGGRFLVMEVEMIEPMLHLADQPVAAADFADVIVARLGSTAAR